MKIFSWVHRQFHHKDAKNTDNDKVALLENEAFAFAGACDGWREGILAIGTLGIDLFQDFKEKDDTFMNNHVLVFDDGDDDPDHDEEMECPLVLRASKHGFDHVEKQHLNLPCDDAVEPNNHQEDLVNDSTKISKTRERTTLAELFRADSEHNLLKNNNELSDDHTIKLPHDATNNKTTTESIKSFLISKMRKKLRKDEPIKKTKQLMRKLLKNKIHPDIGIQKETALMIVSQEMDVHAT